MPDRTEVLALAEAMERQVLAFISSGEWTAVRGNRAIVRETMDAIKEQWGPRRGACSVFEYHVLERAKRHAVENHERTTPHFVRGAVARLARRGVIKDVRSATATRVSSRKVKQRRARHGEAFSKMLSSVDAVSLNLEDIADVAVPEADDAQRSEWATTLRESLAQLKAVLRRIEDANTEEVGRASRTRAAQVYRRVVQGCRHARRPKGAARAEGGVGEPPDQRVRHQQGRDREREPQG